VSLCWRFALTTAATSRYVARLRGPVKNRKPRMTVLYLAPTRGHETFTHDRVCWFARQYAKVRSTRSSEQAHVAGQRVSLTALRWCGLGA